MNTPNVDAPIDEDMGAIEPPPEPRSVLEPRDPSPAELGHRIKMLRVARGLTSHGPTPGAGPPGARRRRAHPGTPSPSAATVPE